MLSKEDFTCAMRGLLYVADMPVTRDGNYQPMAEYSSVTQTANGVEIDLADVKQYFGRDFVNSLRLLFTRTGSNWLVRIQLEGPVSLRDWLPVSLKYAYSEVEVDSQKLLDFWGNAKNDNKVRLFKEWSHV